MRKNNKKHYYKKEIHIRENSIKVNGKEQRKESSMKERLKKGMTEERQIKAWKQK